MDFRGINPLPDKSAQRKEKQKVRHFPLLSSSHEQETSSDFPNALDKKRKSPASPETEMRRTRARTRAIGEDGKSIPNALDNKGKSPVSPEAEQRRARAIGEDGKSAPREIKRSSASGLRQLRRGLRKLKLWGGETSQGKDGDKRIGKKFGNYRIVKLLGKGGFANVYLGEHIDSKEPPAAVKLLRMCLIDQKELEEFRREAGILISLSHKNIVRVLEFGTKREVPFLVMEYAPHGTLRHAHLRGEPLSLTQVVKYVNQIADALDYLHREKKMHLDIKPDNLFLGEDLNGEKKVLLGDFGLAQTVHNTASRITPDKVAGTVSYMDPEYILGGPPCPASDQYALGVKWRASFSG